MNKIELFKKLDTLDIDKEKYIVISGASLVAQDVIEDTPDIDISTTKEIYDSLNWNTKIGSFGKEIKCYDVFEISDHLYDEEYYVRIDGYKFMPIDSVYRVKKSLDRIKDQEIIQKLESILENSYKDL